MDLCFRKGVYAKKVDMIEMMKQLEAAAISSSLIHPSRCQLGLDVFLLIALKDDPGDER